MVRDPHQLEGNSSGFTLLEVLLAVSLSLVLLTALYAALKLHLTFAQRAPEQTQTALLGRAVLERVARDIRAVIPPASGSADAESGSTESSTAAGSGESTGAAAGTSGTSTTATAGAADSSSTADSTMNPDAYRAAYGVMGGTDWLQLYVADSNPNLDDIELAAGSGSLAQAATILRVTYSLVVRSTRVDASGRTERLALVRSEVAAIGAEQFDSNSSDADMRATSEYLADDVSFVQFQYWDDFTGSWLDSWGVDAPIAPPRAIRITLSLLKPDEFMEQQMGLSNLSTWQPTFQLVVPIATWNPESEYGSDLE